jgi:hypothetical protein
VPSINYYLLDFPARIGQNGKVLMTDGVSLNWIQLATSDLSDASLIPMENTVNTFTAQQYFAETELTDSATINWAVATAQVAKVTLAGNRTMAAPTGLQNGAFYSLMVIQDSNGSKTISWNSAFKWPGTIAPILTTTANAKDLFVFRSDGTNLYEVGRALNLG